MENGKLAIITPDRYDEACDIMANHFFPDNPLCQAFGVSWNDDIQKTVLENLKANLSICMTTKDTDELIGVRITSVMRKTDPPKDLNTEYEPLRSMITLIALQDKEVNFFERYKVEEVVHFFTLGVKKNYRRMGVGSRLFEASLAMCREFGFKAIKGGGTSKFSHFIYEKQGFELLSEMPLDSYYYNGRPIIDGTGGHNVRKIYGLKI